MALIDHPAWTRLTGEDLSFADYSYLRDKALQRLQELARLSRAMGCRGLVVLFDEVETVDQLWNIVSRMGAYRVLGTLCRMKYVWCVFAITDRFERAIDSDLDDGILNQPGAGVGSHAFSSVLEAAEPLCHAAARDRGETGG